MAEAIAVTVSCDWPACVVRVFGSEDEFGARLSDLMQSNFIRVRAGDLVTVALDEDPPQVQYRWCRWQVSSREGDRIAAVAMQRGNVAPAAGPDEAVVGEFDPQVGDCVYLTGAPGSMVVFDVEVDGEPSRPDAFAQRMREAREARG